MSVSMEKYGAPEEYVEADVNRALKQLRLPITKNKEQVWESLLATINTPHTNPKVQSRSLNFFIYAAAASIAVLVSIGLLMYMASDTTVTCPSSQTLQWQLPEGSSVRLNAASFIRYNRLKWFKKRSVFLYGEAFFKVTKGRPFEVFTNTGRIKVLGTTFNIYTRNSILKVYCETGRVAVITSNTVLLYPGTQTLSHNSQKCKVMVHAHEGSWRQGEFWFESTPLNEVIEEMQRQFNITIVCQDLEHRTYTGYFNNTSLDAALHTVFDPMQLRIKKENKNRYIIY